jgi:hypothetical protein
MKDETAPYISKAWESTCRVFLGRPVGGIETYEKYLQKYVMPCGVSKSALSGDEVVVTGNYAKGSKFIAGNEIQRYAPIIEQAKLNINEIKDIDSILRALSEHICYSGSDVLGNSSFVAHSNRIVDSSFVYKAHDVFYSKYVAHTYLSKYSEYIFGCESVGQGTHFAVKSFETWQDSRLFECVRVYLSSDIMYSANLEHCSDCLFSFNLRSKQRCIGNLALSQENYSKLKAKLQEEMAQELESKRALISILDIIGG